jgi:hypothetical protein
LSCLICAGSTLSSVIFCTVISANLLAALRRLFVGYTTWIVLTIPAGRCLHHTGWSQGSIPCPRYSSRGHTAWGTRSCNTPEAAIPHKPVHRAVAHVAGHVAGFRLLIHQSGRQDGIMAIFFYRSSKVFTSEPNLDAAEGGNRSMLRVASMPRCCSCACKSFSTSWRASTLSVSAATTMR